MESGVKNAENKRYLVKLSTLARECGAGPTEMLVTLVQAVFADEAMTDTRLAEFCGISRATLHRMKVDEAQRWKRLVKEMKKEDFLAPSEKSGGVGNVDVAVEAVSVSASVFVEGEVIDDARGVAQGDSRAFKTASEKEAQPLVEMETKTEPKIERVSGEVATPEEAARVAKGASVVGEVVKPTRSQDCRTEGERIELFFDLYDQVHRVKRDTRGMLIVELRKCASMGYTLAGVLAILEDCLASEAWKANPSRIPTPSSFVDWLVQLTQGADGEAHPAETWRQIARSIRCLRTR